MSVVLVLGKRDIAGEYGMEERDFWYFVEEKELNLDRLQNEDLIIHFTSIEEVNPMLKDISYQDLKRKIESKEEKKNEQN